MYLFSRRIRLGTGNTQASMAWVATITEKVNQISSLGTSAFATVFSPEVGTIAFSTFAPDLESLEAASDKINADSGFVALVDEGAKYVVGGADDLLGQIIHGDIDPNRKVEYATTVQAVCATGHVTKGMELGVEIAQRAEKTTGLPTAFLSGMSGEYGAVSWLTGYADIKELERANAALAADTSFGKFVDDKARGVYADDPTMTRQLIYRRII